MERATRYARLAALGTLYTSASVLALAASPTLARDFDDEVIYGDDDRKEIFDPTNSPRMINLARATAALLDRAHLQKEDAHLRLPGTSFGESAGLCEDEPYREQPNPAWCSGFLVGENILVTAGHCIRSQESCDATAFAFGFSYDTSADQDVTLLEQDNVYYCKELLAQELNNNHDFAVIELDRKVVDRAPLRYRQEGEIEQGTAVTVIGHPAGLPTKIAGGAQVRDIASPYFFKANIDAYGGNSGSAVFNSNTGEVEGILVRGEADFVRTPDGCRQSKRCTNHDCGGEDVIRTSIFAPHIPDPADAARPRVSHDYTLSDLDAVIPDGDEAGLVQEVEVGIDGTLASVKVAVKIEHTFAGDIVISLVHPDGTRAVLREEEISEDTIIDETYANTPALRVFKGKPAAGVWKLIVQDMGPDDEGTLKAVTLSTTLYADEPSQED